MTGGELRPCLPTKTALAVGESLVVPDGIAPLAPASQLQFLAAAPAVTGGESRPGDPRTLVEVEAVAEGEPRPCLLRCLFWLPGSQEYKSISGFTAFYAGFPVFWLTVRQPFIALSTAEAELLSVMDGVAATRRVSSFS